MKIQFFHLSASILLFMNTIQAAEFDLSSLKLFTDGSPYLEKYETGLYPGGKNIIPEEHRKEGEKIATSIVPRDANGKVDAQNGKILALILGHSNCKQYFGALINHASKNTEKLNPRFQFVNSAVNAQQLPEISTLEGGVWDQSKTLLTGELSAQQVQVLFLHTTYHRFKNKNNAPTGPFPETMQAMQRDLTKVLEHCVKLYPNLKIAYLTCDGHRHFTGFEPHVWQEAFAYKWLIESQIQKKTGTEYDGASKKLPWLQWGPYFWDNTWDHSYFSDGVHPADKARDIFIEKYWNHLSSDPVAKKWMFR
jgi:hypothetical protein